jgi:hypothetical protein
MASSAPIESAVSAPFGLLFQPEIEPRKPAARSASPTDVPSRPVPRMAMRSIMFAFLSSNCFLKCAERAELAGG